MGTPLHPTVVDALDRFGNVDPAAALDVASAMEWLVGGHGLDRLHRAGLQQFLWYELPFKWLGPVRGRHQLADSLGRFFDIAGLTRYAALCRGPMTHALIDSWHDDPNAGYDAFHRAHLASGVVPPDLDDFAWGDVMGDVELAAFWSTAQMLELTIEAGELEPSANPRRRRWIADQRRLVGDHLDQTRPELFGESLRDAVLGERLGAWADAGTSDARSSIVAGTTNLLLHDVAPPSGATRAVAPLRWLLERLDRGVRAASTGGLPTRLVLEAAAQFGWGEVPTRAREVDLPPLRAVRAMAVDLRLVRKADGRWTTTAAGRAQRTAPRDLWRSVTEATGTDVGLGGAIDELVFATLVAGERPERETVVDVLRVALTEEGWNAGQHGRPIDTATLTAALAGRLGFYAGFGVLARRGSRPTEPFRLTAAGRAFALASLRARATGPRVLAGSRLL